MSWAWTRTFYASRNGTIFNFEMKRQRDDAVKHHGFEKVLSAEAMKHYPNITRVGWREYGEFIDTAPTIIEAETCNKETGTCNKTDEDAVIANNGAE